MTDMRYAVVGMLLLFALGDSCSPPPNVVGVQDFGRVAGRVLDAMTNRPIPNALISVGSIYTTRADVNGGFMLRTVAGDQTVTARAAGYSTITADTTVPKDGTVSIGYLRLVPLTYPAGQPTLAPPATPTPRPTPSPRPSASASASAPAASPSAAASASASGPSPSPPAAASAAPSAGPSASPAAGAAPRGGSAQP
jgi:hypothetical protein